MKLFNTDLSTKTSLVIVAAITLSAAFLLFSSTYDNSVAASGNVAGIGGPMIADFPGANLGAIPDGPVGTCQPTQGAPRNVTFNVTGITGAPTNVEVSATFGGPVHSYSGDITTTLIAPNGATHSIFGRVSATTADAFGSADDLVGPYNFADNHLAPPNGGFWQAATAAAAIIPSGDYRTTNSGGAGAVNPAPATNMNPAFAGVANANGTWTLRFTDGCAQDTGAVSAATLTVAGAVGPPPDANADFDGDGRTDFTVARGTLTPFAEGQDLGATAVNRRNVSGLDARPAKVEKPEVPEVGPQGPPIYWYTRFSGNGSVLVSEHGDAATDFITPEDFDGDGRDDLVVWTEAPATQANFKIFQSSNNTLRVENFGQTGDDPAIVGDYDGDGRADPAVFRCPPVSGADGQCVFFYRGSMNNPMGNITFIPWGFGVEGDFFPLIGDFDGDGRYDFNIQRANPAAPSQGQFVLLRSSDLAVEHINWGLSSDFLIPGDYDGDGRHDLLVRRTVSGVRQNFLLTRAGTTNQVQWGITGDVSVPGDYDGDGRTDLAIWRPSVDSNNNYYWVLNSSNLSVTLFEWGQCPSASTCDFPVAGWAVH